MVAVNLFGAHRKKVQNNLSAWLVPAGDAMCLPAEGSVEILDLNFQELRMS